jgi:hypothetical protein
MADPREVLELKVWKLKTLMAAPLGVLAANLAAATTEIGDVDGRPSGGAGGRSDSGHH